MVTAAVVTAAVVTAAVVLSSTSDEADGTATTAGMFFCGFCCFLGFLARGGENDPNKVPHLFTLNAQCSSIFC